MISYRSWLSTLTLMALTVGCTSNSENHSHRPEQTTASTFCADFQANYRQWDTTRKDFWTTGPEKLANAAKNDARTMELMTSLKYLRSAVNKDGGPTSGGGVDIDFRRVRYACRAVMGNESP